MRKELLVTLLRKDISELAQMTDGFEELDYFPPVLINLAQDKARNIAACLSELGELSAPKPTEQAATKGETQSTSIPEAIVPVIAPVVEEMEVEEPTAPIEVEDAPPAIEEEVIETPLAVVEEEIEEEAAEEEYVEDETEEETMEEEEDAELTAVTPPTTAPTTYNAPVSDHKVDDIKQAISLGDRFLFQRELFMGRGELLSKTITAINACRTLEDAQRYLGKKFKWDYENPTTQHFMQIVARKFD